MMEVVRGLVFEVWGWIYGVLVGCKGIVDWGRGWFVRYVIGCWKYVFVRYMISGYGIDCLNVRRNLRVFKRS